MKILRSSLLLKTVSTIYRNGSRNFPACSSFWYSFESPCFVKTKCNVYNSHELSATPLPTSSSLRNYAKWKKSSKKSTEIDEDKDDEEDDEFSESEDIDEYNTVTRTSSSLRVDAVLKCGLKVSKKKIEKDFYAGKVRINGAKCLKKSVECKPKDEIDLVQGFSPDNPKFLQVDRVIIQSIGKITGTGNYPLTMQVLKMLTIENYPEPWVKTDLQESE